MNWYFKVLKQYADFNGRARRTEYWMFLLFSFYFALIAMYLDQLMDLTLSRQNVGLIYFIYALFIVIPAFAAMVRRLHDIGESGWMLLISLIPVAGAIWLFILLLKKGNSGSNEYGSDPREGYTIGNGEGQVGLIFNPVNSSTKDTLLLVIIICFLWGGTAYNFLNNNIGNPLFISLWVFMVRVYAVIILVIPIALSFLIKNHTKQKIAFIAGSLFFILHVLSQRFPPVF